MGKKKTVFCILNYIFKINNEYSCPLYTYILNGPDKKVFFFGSIINQAQKVKLYFLNQYKQAILTKHLTQNKTRSPP